MAEDVIRHVDVQANGLRFHCAEAGDPLAPMILFLHGFPEFWYAWRKQLETLSGDWLCVAPDCRGINRTEQSADLAGYEIGNLVDDVAGIIAAYGRERVVLVGHDWGGFMAWEVAIRRPDLIEKLVIINCAHPGIMSELLHEPDSEQATRSQYMLAFRSDQAEELVTRDDHAGLRTNILEPGLQAGHLTEEDAAAYMVHWLTPGSLTAGLYYYRANKSGPPSGDDAAPRRVADTRVSVPTLVLWGEGDPYFAPECLNRMPEAGPDIRIVRYPENDHWIAHQIPDEISRQIGQFAGSDRTQSST
ncbi:MAG: alpha/beta hydrolase [Minwuia sp.]|nr:alpha/beta hydrolase [Minwuia sp.]